MKKLDKFLLKSFVGPFVGILLLVIFILMMQFLWVYIDELVGKGLSFRVIVEFMAWGGTTMLPLSMPLATLLASVMTIGNMSENFELIAMKASGISLARVLKPLIYVSLLICVAAFFVSNNLVPYAWNKIYSLRDDIKMTKDEINIPTGIFYDGIDGYVLRVDSKNDETGMMHGVMVYDHTGDKGSTAMIIADSAKMTMSKNKDYLIFDLYEGTNYSETNSMKNRDTTLQLQRIKFSKQEMVIPLEHYAFQKSEGDKFGNQVKTMSLKKLDHGRDSVGHLLDSTSTAQHKSFMEDRSLKYAFQLDTSKHLELSGPMDRSDFGWKDSNAEKRAYEQAITAASGYEAKCNNFANDIYPQKWYVRSANVEYLKKFAGALACLVMFLIGGPLGAFTKRSGLGTSAIIAALFFVLYWVVDITGVKLARDGATSAGMGAFVSTLVLMPIGIYLTIKAVNDSSPINTENFGTWWRKTKSKVMSIFKKTRIVYMGTPEFAVAPLEALINAGYDVVGVVTVADKPSGRGLKMNESAVKKYAVEHNIPVLQPLKLKDPEFLEQLAAWKADLFVVVAFRMLPEVVWKMPTLGTINLHAALLPQYRGAAPINWAVINGEKLSGVTTFMIDENIDTGGIILRQECRIQDTDTAGDLHDKLMPIGAKLVVETVEGLIEKNVETRVQRSFIQGSEVLKPAPKITKELCHVDWNDSTTQIYNLIRGLSPYPTAYTELIGADGVATQLKIFGATVADSISVPAGTAAGTVLSDGKSYMAITTADGAISLTDVQLAGKKRMDIKAFLAGFRDPMSYKASQGTSKAEIAKTKEA